MRLRAEAAGVDESNDFDKACRYLAKRRPAGLFAWLLPGHT